MAENNQNAMAGSAPAKQKPAVSKGGGVNKPPVERADPNPYNRSRLSDIGAWLQDRFYVVMPVIDYLKKKEVPKHRLSFWYYFGGLGLFFFMVQIITGLLLMQYYKPTSAEAYASFVFIQREVSYGWLVRQIHAWSANLMVLMVFVHMFSSFFMKSYRKPRELMWLTGSVLFVLTLGFGFTGYLLPWNEIAFFATQVGTEVPKVMPGGAFIVNILRGGEEVTGETLTRMFSVHVVLLPGLLLLLLSAHLLLVQILGTSAPIGYKETGRIKGYDKFFPTFLAKDAIGWLIGFGLILYLAVVLPGPIGLEANPLSPAPEGIKPEWYFWAQFLMLKDFSFEGGELLAIVLITLGAGIWFMVPFLDRKASREEKSPIFTIIGLLYLAGLVINTWRVFATYGW